MLERFDKANTVHIIYSMSTQYIPFNFFLKIYADAEVNPDDAFKFYYVFKGPKKDKSKKLYYVYGTNINSYRMLASNTHRTNRKVKDTTGQNHLEKPIIHTTSSYF